MKTVTKTTSWVYRAPPIALSATDATPADGASGVWIQLMPAGTFSGRTGRGPFVAGDQAALSSIVDRSKKRAGSTDLVIDYDHQTVFSAVPGVGGTAPAAGWIKDLEARPDGIWGLVEWTASAAMKIRTKKYRYISPTFSAPDKGGKVGVLVSAGLTNIPDLDLAPITASAFHQEQEPDMKSIAKALGLPEDASEEQILAAMSALTASNAALVAASGAAKPEEAVTAITAMRTNAGKVDPAKFVPIEQLVAMQADLTALKDKDAAQEVQKAISAGKILPAMKDWALDLYKNNLEAFSAFVEKAPVITASQRSTAAAATTQSDAELDDSDLQVMSQLGLTREQMLKSKKGAAA